jgi:hypothetical protein
MNIPHFKLSYGKRFRPARDWAVILVIGLLCLVASVGWNLWLFGQVAGGAVLGSHPAPPTTGIDQSELDKLSKIFTDRSSEFTKYEDGSYRFIDPSK